jgi:hypothetical protein
MRASEQRGVECEVQAADAAIKIISEKSQDR